MNHKALCQGDNFEIWSTSLLRMEECSSVYQELKSQGSRCRGAALIQSQFPPRIPILPPREAQVGGEQPRPWSSTYTDNSEWYDQASRFRRDLDCIY